MKRVLVWRYQQFKPSENFILNQAQMLKEFSPLLLGGKVCGESQYSVPFKTGCHIGAGLVFGKSSKINRVLTDFKPDLIHAHFCIDASMLLGALTRREMPLVVTCHGFDATISRKQMLFSKRVPWIWHALNEKRLARRANVFICVSDFIRKKMIERGYPERKLITHYIGIDTERIKPDVQVQKYERPTVFAAARFTEKKGLQYLIEAFMGVRARCADAELLIAGDGPLRPQLEQQIMELGLGDCVKLLGMLTHTNVLEMMKRAWLFCVPSITARNGDAEGLGMVFLEAQALGVPVVSTRSGGIPEAVSDTVSGYLVAEKNAESLAERMLYILNNGPVRETLGAQARLFVERKFDIRTQTVGLENIYRTVL